MRWTQSTGWISSLVAVIATLALFTSSAGAQEKKVERPKVPAPEDIEIETIDGVTIQATYYPSYLGKKAVPVLLVHGWEGRRTQFEPLAKYLQAEGAAVIVPDLRGHGTSSVRKLPGQAPETIKPEDLNARDLVAASTHDFMAIKNDLMARQNKGEFNIELLTIVGVEAGAILAMNWAAIDWSQPDLPTIKLGYDVKAIVLVSPTQKHRTLTMQGALRNKNMLSRLSFMIIGGANDRLVERELASLKNQIGRYHPELKQKAGESDQDFRTRLQREKDFFFYDEPTNLQGIDLINAPNLNEIQKIAGFIKLRLSDRQESKDLPSWTEDRRTNVKLPGTP
jgi:pimeloyl-ACP methyl ester carboxylesterase